MLCQWCIVSRKVIHCYSASCPSSPVALNADKQCHLQLSPCFVVSSALHEYLNAFSFVMLSPFHLKLNSFTQLLKPSERLLIYCHKLTFQKLSVIYILSVQVNHTKPPNLLLSLPFILCNGPFSLSCQHLFCDQQSRLFYAQQLVACECRYISGVAERSNNWKYVCVQRVNN